MCKDIVFCPKCKRGLLANSDTNFENGRYYTEIYCTVCGFIFYEVYVLNHYEDEEGNEINE